MRHRRCPAPASRTGGTCTSKRDCGGAGGRRACSRSRLRLPELHLRRRHVPQPPRRSPDVTGSKSPRRGIHPGSPLPGLRRRTCRRLRAGPGAVPVLGAMRPLPGRRRSGLEGLEGFSQFFPDDPPHHVLVAFRDACAFSVQAPPDQLPQRHTRSGSGIHPLSQVCREVDACPLVTACHTANVPQGCTAGKRSAARRRVDLVRLPAFPVPHEVGRVPRHLADRLAAPMAVAVHHERHVTPPSRRPACTSRRRSTACTAGTRTAPSSPACCTPAGATGEHAAEGRAPRTEGAPGASRA